MVLHSVFTGYTYKIKFYPQIINIVWISQCV